MSSAKRSASNQLTHDNWEAEEEPEDRGTFQQASQEELKSRKIKVAKRRGIVGGDLSESRSTFKGFAGFGTPSSKPATEISGSTPTTLFSFKTSTGSSAAPSFSFKTSGPADISVQPIASTLVSAVSPTSKPAQENNHEENVENLAFLSSLKALNFAILKWLKSHMDKNPYCYFTPVFADYEEYLDTLKKQYKFGSGLATSQSATSESDTNGEESAIKQSKPATKINFASQPSGSSPMFSFGSTQKVTQPVKNDDPKSDVSFGAKTNMTDTVTKPSADSLFTGISQQDSASDVALGTDSVIKVSDNISSSPTSQQSEAVHQKNSTPFSFGLTSAKPLVTGGFSFGSKGTTSSTGPMASTFSFGKADSSSKPSTSFSFGKTSTDAPTTASLSFGKTSTDAPTTASLSFGKTSTDAPTTASFSFGKTPAAGFTFGSSSTGTSATSTFSFKTDVANASAPSSTTATADEEEYEPPKPEGSSVTEDDALYTKRVKLFYEKDGKFVDKDIGNLFIKPLDSGKKSLLIRADTALGNILLNIVLSDKIPLARLGKNNVTMVCVANPPMHPKAEEGKSSTLLIRVKTAEDADELLEKLKLYSSAD